MSMVIWDDRLPGVVLDANEDDILRAQELVQDLEIFLGLILPEAGRLENELLESA